MTVYCNCRLSGHTINEGKNMRRFLVSGISLADFAILGCIKFYLSVFAEAVRKTETKLCMSIRISHIPNICSALVVGIKFQGCLLPRG